MALLDQIAADANAIVTNVSEFSKVRTIDGRPIECVMHARGQAPDPALDQFQSEPTRRREAVLIVAQWFIKRPPPGSRLVIDDVVWQVISCRVIGRAQCRLALSLWEG